MPYTRVVSFSRDGASTTWRMVSRQPSWVVRLAAIAFLLVIGLPILLLFLFAFMAAMIVFFVLAAFNAVRRAITGALPVRDGRSSNIRIVRGPRDGDASP